MSKHKELISTDNTTLKLDNQTYRISVKIYHHVSHYNIKSIVTRLSEGTTPNDHITSFEKTVMEKEDLQKNVNKMTERGAEAAKQRHQAKQLDLNITADIS